LLLLLLFPPKILTNKLQGSVEQLLGHILSLEKNKHYAIFLDYTVIDTLM